jgi:hypothetical protein
MGSSLLLQPQFRLAEMPQRRPGVRRPPRHLGPSEVSSGHTAVCRCLVEPYS